MKKLLSFFLALASGTASFAQAASPVAQEKAGQLANIMSQTLLIGGGILFLVVLIYLINFNQLLYRRMVGVKAAAPVEK